MAGSTTTFHTDDLLLKVSENVDPTVFDLGRFEAFIDLLCGAREYQKKAIRTTCRFLAGAQYLNTRELAEANYEKNSFLGERYGSLDGLVNSLPFPEKLACSVDLATGTGKSYVMYGVARILLAAGVVDRVLLLCPSLTIEAGLTVKFKSLSGDHALRRSLPDDSVIRNPEIVDASVTTKIGDICIENIHATFEHVNSSVRDSFMGNGPSTLVLCDEAHHIYSKPVGASRPLKEWRRFLESEEFAFQRIAGFSGTCFVGDEYFPDVIYRYSIRQAMEDHVVKHVAYRVVSEAQETTESRFQKYAQLHHENQKRYPTVKPLSIVVANTVKTVAHTADQFIKFISDAEGLTMNQASERVLVVSSRKDHRANVARLAYVDELDDPTQWIFSVSLLTEGWDVQNVFQIVPHEKRAFNSKLLIAQVLGRGLRVPPGTASPTVWVFNHVAWASEIKGLVDEVLEQERRLHAYPVTNPSRSSLHFSVHNLSYQTLLDEQDLKLKSDNGQVKLFTRGFVQFENQPAILERTDVFTDVLTQVESTLRTRVKYEAHSVDDVVRRIRARLLSIDTDGSTQYAKDYPLTMIRSVVEESLKRIGENRRLVSEQNLQQLYRAIGNIHRQQAKTVRITLKPGQLEEITTSDLPARSVSLSQFLKDARVFYDDHSREVSTDEDRRRLDEIAGEESDFPQKASTHVANAYLFRSPVNVVLTSHGPERDFTKRLFEQEVATKLKSWVKAPDQGWYGIDYSWRKGDHTKRARFHPDFFLVLAQTPDVLVVEIKDDGDDSDENRAKLRFAREHFERVNEAQTCCRYSVKFISPNSYDAFFQALRAGEGVHFVSTLQATLSE